jgi:hypothetical protein
LTDVLPGGDRGLRFHDSVNQVPAASRIICVFQGPPETRLSRPVAIRAQRQLILALFAEDGGRIFNDIETITALDPSAHCRGVRRAWEQVVCALLQLVWRQTTRDWQVRHACHVVTFLRVTVTRRACPCRKSRSLEIIGPQLELRLVRQYRRQIAFGRLRFDPQRAQIGDGEKVL